MLVSELMLQQTQVARVAEAWPPFLARFPDVAALADAPVAHVIDAWHGLGYNRRAVNLQRAAVVIVGEHGGEVPSDLAALQRLPGIGPYTARAVAAFAFGAQEAPVDTNVARVLARAVAGAQLTTVPAQALADDLVPPDAPGPWSQALMDLGAQTCTARAPRCAACPVAQHCAWLRAGRPAPDPAAPRSGARQGRFEGSDRWHRGRVVDALRGGPVAADAVAQVAGLAEDQPRAERIIAGLVADGLVEQRGEFVALPGSPDV